MASGKRLDLGRIAYSGDKETGKLLKMSHEDFSSSIFGCYKGK